MRMISSNKLANASFRFPYKDDYTSHAMNAMLPSLSKHKKPDPYNRQDRMPKSQLRSYSTQPNTASSHPGQWRK